MGSTVSDLSLLYWDVEAPARLAIDVTIESDSEGEVEDNDKRQRLDLQTNAAAHDSEISDNEDEEDSDDSDTLTFSTGKRKGPKVQKGRASKNAGKKIVRINPMISLEKISPFIANLARQNFSSLHQPKIGTRQQVQISIGKAAVSALAAREAATATNKKRNKTNMINMNNDSGNRASASSSSSSSSSLSLPIVSDSQRNTYFFNSETNEKDPYEKLSGIQIKELMTDLHPEVTINGIISFDRENDKNSIGKIEESMIRLCKIHTANRLNNDYYEFGKWTRKLNAFFDTLSYELTQNIIRN
jgi:hypothetical protein